MADATETLTDGDVVRTALLCLPVSQREVIVLRFFLDLTEQQTAEAMNIPIGTVKSRASRALTALAADGHLVEAMRGDAS